MDNFVNFLKKNQKTIIISVLSGLGFLILLKLIFGSKFVRYSGNLPYLWNPEFNKSIQIYSSSRPSRYIFAISGAYRSGKSRAMNIAAQKDFEKGFSPIIVDYGLINNIEDAIEITKLKVVECLTKSASHLTSSDLKQLSEFSKYDKIRYNTSVNFLDNYLMKPYKAIASALDSIFENKTFHEYGVYRFFDVLSFYEKAFHFVLYIHNYDTLKNLVDSNGKKIGEKLTNAALSRLSNSDQFTQYIPIFVEIKNSLSRIDNNELVVYRMTPPIERELNQFVAIKAFTQKEMKTIQQEFGPHPGIISDIYEDLRYDMPLDKALNKARQNVNDKVNQVTGGKTNKAIQDFCRAKDKVFYQLPDQSTADLLAPLFQNGLLVLKRGLRVAAANKAVKQSLCNLK